MEFSTIAFMSSIPWLSLISILFTHGAYAQFVNLPNQQLSKSTEIAFANNIRTLLTEGDRLLEMKDFAGAIAHYERALAIAEKNQSREHQALILAALGRVYDLNGKYLKAEKTFKEGMARVTESRNPSMEMRQSQIYLHTGLGMTYHNIGKYEQAIAQLKQAVSISAQLPRALWGSTFIPWEFTHFEPRFYLATAYRSIRQYPQAISLFQECHAIALKEGDREKQAISLVALGQTHATLGDLPLARQYFQKVKALGTFPNNPDLVRAIDTLDVLSGDLADMAESFIIFLPVLERVSRGLRRIEEVTPNLPNFAYVGRSAAKLESAHAKFLQLIPQLRQKDIFGSFQVMVATINEMSSLLKELKSDGDGTTVVGLDNSCNLDEIRAVIKQGNYERGNLSPEAVTVIVEVADDLCKITKSLENYNDRRRKQGQKSKQNFDMETIIRQLEDVDRRSTSRRGQVNLEIAQNQVAIAKSSGNPLDYGKALNFLGNAYASQKAYAQAEQSLSEAITIWEKLRVGLEDKEEYRVALFETQNDTYKSLQKVRMAMGKYSEALESAEQGRARAFLALLSSKFSSDRLEQYSEPQVNISQLQQIARDQQITIVSYSLISSKSLEFLRDASGTSQLYVWVISPQGEISWRDLNLQQWEMVKHQKSLREVIQDLQERLTSSSGTIRTIPDSSRVSLTRRPVAVTSDRDAIDELKQLHELLIEPIADLLPQSPDAKVVFVPDQALFLVPFAALQTKSGKYLIEDHTISYSPSIQSLDYTKRLGKRLENLPKATGNLIVGNPSEDLADAALEATAIAKLLNTQPLIGKVATKNKVLAQIEDSQIIHLAMHGNFDDNNGLDSALSFGSQVFLTAKEILNLSLRANLVILSACNTGKGAIRGDGVIGLSRAFILAGTPRIIVSLWSVPDSETSQLMMNFYRNMVDNKSINQGYAHALRQSMLYTLKHNPHPRNWAAFGLIGAVN